MLDFTAPVSENDFPLLFTMNLGPEQHDSQPFFLEHVSQSCHKGFLKASVGDTKPDMHFILWHRSACMMRAKPGALFKKCELKR